jgi:hypothetical protein
MKKMECDQSRANTCLFFKWDSNWGLAMWLAWIDDKLCFAYTNRVEHEKELLKKHFKCDDIGEVQDYIGCKIDISDIGRSFKMMKPVLMQSLTDEFEDIVQGRASLVPVKPGDILTKCKNSNKLKPKQHSRYQTGVGRLLYLMKHSSPDIANAVRKLARHCHDPTKVHWEAMCECI